MSTSQAIMWFRRDLRLHDNPAWVAAARYDQVYPIYIDDTHIPSAHQAGQATKVWRHHSLQSLNHDLDHCLSIYRGDAFAILQHLVTTHQIHAVSFNQPHTPWETDRDQKIIAWLRAQSIEVHTFNGALLWDPQTILKPDSTPYKVFTPFYRKGCLSAPAPRRPLERPNIKPHRLSDAKSIEDLKLLPTLGWDQALIAPWTIGELAAHQRLNDFLDTGIDNYKEGRNFPAKPHVSMLSPALAMGELSPNQAWYGAQSVGDNRNVDHFCSELGWREFSYNQLYYNRDMHQHNLQEKFDAFPWQSNPDALKAWQLGQTGIPMVDAGMRQLYQTGYMHNRLRMVVASFLVKNLMIDWREGERWFWDCLFDADPANNRAGWQWVAGCGYDAAPYFRIFNCVTQGQKFDPDGQFIRQYVPELRHLATADLYAPWQVPSDRLKAAGVELGQTYPNPIVNLSTSRQDALDAFASLRSP